MKFEEALENFKNEIAKEYGLEEVIIKIGIHPKLMSYIGRDIYLYDSHLVRFTPSQFGEFILNGVQLLPREKDNF